MGDELEDGLLRLWPGATRAWLDVSLEAYPDALLQSARRERARELEASGLVETERSILAGDAVRRLAGELQNEQPTRGHWHVYGPEGA